MTAQEYIQTELEELAKQIELVDLGSTPIDEAILARVMSKKFRKLKADQATIDFVKGSIHIATSAGKPLYIGCVHGGTKLWRSDEYPEADWAELFNIIYYTKWMRSIAEVYKRGVVLEYFSMDVVQERLNNLPRAETDQYTDSFKSVIEWVKQYLPNNIAITYRRYGEAYKNLSEYDVDIENTMEKVSKELNGKLPVLSGQQRYATELNVRPTEDQLKDSDWREKVEVMHMSVERTKAMDDYINEKHLVPACPTPWPGVLVTGSTKKSIAKFWVGSGALEKSDNGFNEIILTPKQLASAKFDWEDVNIEGLKGKNFTRIRVLKDA